MHTHTHTHTQTKDCFDVKEAGESITQVMMTPLIFSLGCMYHTIQAVIRCSCNLVVKIVCLLLTVLWTIFIVCSTVLYKERYISSVLTVSLAHNI